jgi:tetratricopeptide (TPR) repeat protein
MAGAAPESAPYRGRLPEVRAELSHATALFPANAQAWSDLAYATVLGIPLAPEQVLVLGREAEAAAGRAVAISPACSEFWIRRGVARDLQGRFEDADRDFSTGLEAAPADAYAWYYYAEHLSRLRASHEPAWAAVQFCLRLDPGNGPGLALRQRLAIKVKPH